MLRASARTDALADWLAAVPEALERELGYDRASLVLVLDAPQPSPRRAFAGAVHGIGPEVLSEYFEHWAEIDPLASEPARAMFEARGLASTAALYPECDAPRRRFVDEFLARNDVADQLSLWLRGDGIVDGYLTLQERDVVPRERQEVLRTLADGLAVQLQAYLPRGLPDGLPDRGRQVAELVALGLTNREIGLAMNIGEDTVKKHLQRTMAKLGVTRRTQLAVSWTTGRVVALPPVGG
jgi:DNA-binding CsgD family transcriptional regulator